MSGGSSPSAQMNSQQLEKAKAHSGSSNLALTILLLYKGNDALDVSEVFRDQIVVINLHVERLFKKSHEVQHAQRIDDARFQEWHNIIEVQLPCCRKLFQNESPDPRIDFADVAYLSQCGPFLIFVPALKAAFTTAVACPKRDSRLRRVRDDSSRRYCRNYDRHLTCG